MIESFGEERSSISYSFTHVLPHGEELAMMMDKEHTQPEREHIDPE